jgi:hypothetical protein
MATHQEQNVEVSNNLVAESDYQAALEAISSTFDAFFVQTNQMSDGGVEGDSADVNARERIDRQRVVQQIYETARQSMMKNLERIVRPIADFEFQNYVDQYHFVADDGDDDEGTGLDVDEVDDDREEAIEDEEIDEEELLDTDAWNSARSLREKLRTVSGNVQSIRDRILQHAEHQIMVTTLADYLDDKRVLVSEEDQDVGDESGHNPNGDELDKENIDNHIKFKKGMTSAHDQELNESLKTLSKLLQDPQWTGLPKRIQSLQDTIGAIQKGTEENRVLSSVEVAIESRTNHAHDTAIQEASRKLVEQGTASTQSDVDGSLESHNSEIKMSAVDRLALFGHFSP